MGLRSVVSLGLVLAGVVGCGQGAPTTPDAPAPVVAAPVAVVPPAAEPAAAPPAPVAPESPNRPPTISGQDVCISPLNADHVFDLALRDRDGDTITWTAEKRDGQGRLHQSRGGPVASETTITIVYSPPADRADENWITITATDSRGGTATKRLYVKNG
jgi:hypothetical protein